MNNRMIEHQRERKIAVEFWVKFALGMALIAADVFATFRMFAMAAW